MMMHKYLLMLLGATLLGTTMVGCSPKQAADTETKSETPAATENSSAAKISADAAQTAGIEIATIGPAQIRDTLMLYGVIKPNAEREQEIRARYAGIVRSANKRTGDHVNKGEVLFTVESNESLQTYTVLAPLTGDVLQRNSNPGDGIDSSTVLMKVADLSTVWVEFAIFSRDLARVRRDMTVLFIGNDADESTSVKLSYVAPAGHADSQSVVARAVVDNRAGKWVPGQFVTGDVVIADINVPVAVSPVALQELNGQTVVFAQVAQGFEPRAVKVGKRSRQAVQILDGLVVGDRYATTNSYLIKADLLKGEAEEE